MPRILVTDEQLVEAVKHSHSMADVLRYIGKRLAGGSHAHYSARIQRLNLDTSHFIKTAWNTGREFIKLRTAENTLIKREGGHRQKSHLLRRALIETGREYCCEKCGQTDEWMGNPITLDVDHINADWLDDRAENLRFLCPNCHSQFTRNQIGAKKKTPKLSVPKVKKPVVVRVPKEKLPTAPCVVCAAPVPGHKHKYCSPECATSGSMVCNWSDIDLIALVEKDKIPYVHLGKRFSVSDTTVKKWYRKQKALQSEASQV